MQRFKQFLLKLSEEDLNKLEQQAKRHGLKKTEYIRTLIQTIHIAENVKEDSKGNMKFQIGEYGYLLEKEYLEQFAKEMETFFKGIEKRMQRVIITNPKSDKRVLHKNFPKSKKVA